MLQVIIVQHQLLDSLYLVFFTVTSPFGTLKSIYAEVVL
jgi:hypothetical protein